MLKKQTTDAFVQQLKRACHWLNIGQGRTRDYVRLLEEFDSVPQRSDKHVLAYYESCEIVEVLDLWENRVHQFPGLKAKLQTACRKGPILADGEENLQFRQQAAKRPVRLSDGRQVPCSGRLRRQHRRELCTSWR